ncbi:MAG: undecaprenyldiphospho-muramoylpentapeptide beta-N-acetylglucosaminyltransferase [Porphyromonadaceae bacterium]|nr:undecaprenyldiphospho-muramoylpentapeptide beta-N-acetylglucosaminyltransferase [Porphyromonadaceae bacterium]
MQRVIISGGGTGGHIFPAISIAQTLKKRYPEVEILFIGAEGRMEMTKVPQAGFQIKGLPVRGLYRKQIWRNVGVLWDFIKSLTMARDIIRSFRPQIVIGVGGYASAPTLKAAQSLGIKTLIQEQNSYAGVSNKLLSRRADKICVAYPDMERFFPKDRIVQTGNPIRAQIEYMGDIDRAEALTYFGFSAEVSQVVLVVGGSLGARTINQSIAKCLEAWSSSGVALIWQTGTSYQEEAQAILKGYKGELYCKAFIERMDLAYYLADLVISRAGAGSISELCLLGKPSILVPSPNVAEDHQTKNALALSERGAAVLIPDREAEARLTDEALALVYDRTKLDELSKNILKLAYHKAADKIVDEVVALSGQGQ